MVFKEIIKRILLGKRYNSDTYIRYLRNRGMEIGKDCIIYVPSKTVVDEQYPWMVSIGDHVRITEGVKILTHDYSWSVIKTINGAILGASGTIKIGNNVFIGMNVIITRDVEIGDNVIIGAGSVVTSNCESDGVYAGNPAKRIMDIAEFIQKRKMKQEEEAKKLAVQYYIRYGKKPEASVFHEYFMLFENEASAKEKFESKLCLCGNESTSLEYMRNNKAVYESFEEFLKFCFHEKE